MPISIDGDLTFNQSVQSIMSTISANQAGAAILWSVGLSGKTLTIAPFSKGRQALYGADNATSAPSDFEDAAPKGVRGSYRQNMGAWYVGRQDNPRTRDVDERYDRVPNKMRGTGLGSDANVYFNPTRGRATGPGSEPDEILLHEIVHSLRMMQGKHNPIPTEDTIVRYDTEEEFLAVVSVNVYISAKKRTKLRGDHWSYKPLETPLDTSAGFLTDPGNAKLMNIYKLAWQPTFSLLSLVSAAAFNPFRELTMRLAYLQR